MVVKLHHQPVLPLMLLLNGFHAGECAGLMVFFMIVTPVSWF